MASSGEGSASVARCMPSIVPPQAVSDRSIIDSVAGFINDVTLQTQAPLGDSKDHILWVRFESAADISDPCLGDDWELEGGIAPPLLLILGYITGVQVWIVPANGEAIEVLSWRHGSVKCLRVLPTPKFVDCDSATELADQFTHKRPLIALCDSSSSGSSAALSGSNSGYQYCSVNFISLKNGETVKSIKFKSPIVDILANRSSIVITFPERIAVFDSRTLEDRLTVTTCHPSPGLNPNPVALGSRWIAYAERRLIPSKRSSGGCEGDGVTSYTATVLNAAKSLGKGLRELGEQVAAGLTGSHLGSSLGSSLVGGGSGVVGIGGVAGFGNNSGSSGDVSSSLAAGGAGSTGNLSEGNQPGVVTVLDIKYSIKDISPTTGTPITCTGSDPIVAHFLAHTEAIVALAFDAPGMLLLTADKRGHDFHLFRLHPHPSGASLAAVHHLYVLHRGDTTAKVQDVAFSLDSRWVAISTLRGTTHVFPVTPYGGPAGVRTHGSPHVVNRLSRFHRSAGLSIDGRSSSPVSHSGDGTLGGTHYLSTTTAYANPRTSPFPHPTVVQPLAQLRQPTSLLGTTSGGSNIGTSVCGGSSKTTSGSHHAHHTRQRNSSSSSSSSDDLVKPLRVCAIFAKARSWLLDPPGCNVRDTPAHRIQRKPVDSLFIMAAHGALIQYDLEPKHVTGTPKEKICDDTPIELEVEAKAQWCLQRQELSTANDIQPPLSLDNWLIKDRFFEEGANSGNSESGTMLEFDRLQHPQHCGSIGSISVDHDDRWLSQVEIITHAGPHRRLWMGPQFMFKTYNTPSGSPLSSIDTEAVEICSGTAGSGVLNRPLQRSNPMNMPSVGGMRPLVPVLIESGSCSSYEQSPRMMNMNEFHHHENLDMEFSSLGPVESQLREDLADAMRESPHIANGKDTSGNLSGSETTYAGGAGNGIGHHQQNQQQQQQSVTTVLNQQPLVSTTGLSSVSSCSSTSIYSSTHSLSSICEHQHQQLQQPYYHNQCQRHKHVAVGGSVGGAGGGSECKISGSGDGDGTVCCPSGGYCSNKANSIVKKNGSIAQSNVQYHPQLCHFDMVRTEITTTDRNVSHGGGITIEKVVNPLGTVTTISSSGSNTIGQDSTEAEHFIQEYGEDYLHENCDEALFRPVVTVHHDIAVDKSSSNEVNLVEMRSNQCRGSSLDRIVCIGGGDVESSDTRKLLVTGFCERPLSQPASLIGRDLIVPVIEKKNLPCFTNNSGVCKKQSPSSSMSEVGQRMEEIGSINLPTIAQVERRDSGTRKKSYRHEQQTNSIEIQEQLPKTVAIDRKDLNCESHSSTKRTLSTELQTSVYEEFENIDLPAAIDEKNNLTSDRRGIVPKGLMCDVVETEIRLDQQITTAHEDDHKEKLVDAEITPMVLNPSIERKNKKYIGNRIGLTLDKKIEIAAGIANETCDIKRTGMIQKGCAKNAATEKDILPEVTPMRSHSEANEELLPPLEALKIDDLELFGEDIDQESTINTAVSGSRTRDVIVMKKACATNNLHIKHDRGNNNRVLEEQNQDQQDQSFLNEQTGLNTLYASLAADDNSHTMLESVETSGAILELSNFLSNRESDHCSDVQSQDAKHIASSITLESPLKHDTDNGNINRKTMGLDYQGTIAVEMQNVFVGGNIVMAICSSLRAASPPIGLESTATLDELEDHCGDEEESRISNVSIHFPAEQQQCFNSSMEGQDSDYKSLELDVEIVSKGIVEVKSMSTSTGAIEAATIATLFSSASEDDEEATSNSTNNFREIGDTCNVGVPDVSVEVNKRDDSISKRRRCRRQCNNHNSVDRIKSIDIKARDDDGDEEDENGEEDDEELQPLISSNKTSSSSLSTTITIQKDPTKSEGVVPLYVAELATLFSHTSLPPRGTEEYTNDKGLAHSTNATPVASMGGTATARSIESDLSASSGTPGIKTDECLITKNSSSSTDLSVSMTSSYIPTKQAGSAAAIGGNGGASKKKSKKKRK